MLTKEELPACPVATHDLFSNGVHLVENGLGCAVCVSGMIAAHNNDKVRFVPFEPKKTSGCVLIWKKNSVLSVPVTLFIQQLTML